MVGENGVPETPDWHYEPRDKFRKPTHSVGSGNKRFPEPRQDELEIPSNIILGTE